MYLKIGWKHDAKELNSFSGAIMRNMHYYFRPGITWTKRTTKGLSFRVLPAGCVFNNRGSSLFSIDGTSSDYLWVLALLQSANFSMLCSAQLAAADAAARSYEVGIIASTPVPPVQREDKLNLAVRARKHIKKAACRLLS